MKRDSNIELLRIIAMIMVLVLHINFFALGAPSVQDVISSTTLSITRFFAEHLCIVGVNVFVLISGWFGIKFKTKGLCNFIFQCLFFSLIIFIPFVATGRIDANRINIMSAFLLYKNAYWFVWAYLILYIMSPVLNAFIEKSDKHAFKRVLILFFSIETVVFIFTTCGFFQAGYNPLSFIGLYLLARYTKLFTKIGHKYSYLATYLLCAFINTVICFIPAFLGIDNETLRTISLSYTNPLNIIGALSLLLYFSKLNFNSKAINYIATSCFAVYLLHMHFCLSNYYKGYAKEIFHNYSGIIYFALITAFIVAVFLISVLIDKIRIVCFNLIWNKYENIKAINDKTAQ